MKRLAIVFLALYTVMAAQGSAFEVNNADNSLMRWNPTAIPVTVIMHPSGCPEVTLASTRSSLTAALDSWSGVTGQAFRFNYAGEDPAAAAMPGDGHNSVVWQRSGWEYGNSVVALTFTSYYLNRPGEIIDSDILLNGQDFQWGSGDGGLDVQYVLAHELGHTLGLSHTGVRKAIMFPYVPEKITYSLSLDDRAGARFLYGPRRPGFFPITPVVAAAYAHDLAGQGLPMPVFRWRTRYLPTTYTLEFSNSSSFERIIRIPAGQSGWRQMKAVEEKRLARFSPTGRIYWRVRSGPEVTSSRPFVLLPK